MLDIFDNFLEDIKIFVIIALMYLLFLYFGGNTAMLNQPFFQIVSYISIGLVGLDILFYIILVIRDIRDGEGASAYSIITVLIALGAAISAPFLIESFSDLTVTNPLILAIDIAIVVFSLVLLVFSIPSFLMPDDDDSEDEPIDVFLQILEPIKLIALIAVMFLFYNNAFQVFPQIVVPDFVLFIIAAILLLINIIISLVDFFIGFADELTFGDWVVLALNVIITIIFVVACCFPNEINGFLYHNGLANALALNNFFNIFIFGFIFYSLAEILISIPINFVGNLFDLFSGE